MENVVEFNGNHLAKPGDPKLGALEALANLRSPPESCLLVAVQRRLYQASGYDVGLSENRVYPQL
jgi:hypothetical protein